MSHELRYKSSRRCHKDTSIAIENTFLTRAESLGFFHTILCHDSVKLFQVPDVIWIDLILLFLLKCGLASRLLFVVICPIFSEIDDTYDNILLVIVKGGLYSPI